jgi:hypothetical protein
MTDKLEMPLEQFAEAVAKENARLIECLKAANENHEHFEREWYLAKDRIEQLETVLRDTLAAWDFWQSQETRNGFSELFASICEARTALGKTND